MLYVGERKRGKGERVRVLGVLEEEGNFGERVLARRRDEVGRQNYFFSFNDGFKKIVVFD